MADDHTPASCRYHQSNSKPRLVELDLFSLRERLGLTSNGPHDVVFVAIDIGGHERIKDKSAISGNCEVGLALLDTRDLQSGSIRSVDLISAYNLAIGTTDFQVRATGKFLFGKSTVATPESILPQVRALIPQNRSIVLVGHDLKQDLLSLRRLGFDLSQFDVTILDTSTLGRRSFGQRQSLGGLLTSLRCPSMALHCSGNDANFALRASILLALRNFAKRFEINRRCTKVEILDSGRKRCKQLEEIAWYTPSIEVKQEFGISIQNQTGSSLRRIKKASRRNVLIKEI